MDPYRPRFPPLPPPPSEFHYSPQGQFPPNRPPFQQPPFQRPPVLPDSRWTGGAYRPDMSYRHPPPPPQHQQQYYTPNYGRGGGGGGGGGRKRRGGFQHSYSGRGGSFGGRGRYQKYQRFDGGGNQRSRCTDNDNSEAFYDKSMFEDPWKDLLPQSHGTSSLIRHPLMHEGTTAVKQEANETHDEGGDTVKLDMTDPVIESQDETVKLQETSDAALGAARESQGESDSTVKVDRNGGDHNSSDVDHESHSDVPHTHHADSELVTDVTDR